MNAANTLDLDLEWGAIDLLEEIEAAFGIKISDQEAERCWTVGDLYKLICAHAPDWELRKGSCPSPMVFYKMRRSLDPERQLAISPRTFLDAVSGGNPKNLFRQVRKGTGLRLPILEMTRLGTVGSWLFFGAVVSLIVTLLSTEWLAAAVVTAVIALAVLMLRIDRARLPTGIATVGELVSRTTALNLPDLRRAGARAPDRWSILKALAADHGLLSADQISPDTFLMRKAMLMAAAR